jgi:HAD superfamily hydrolase (TIGR01509 family)
VTHADAPGPAVGASDALPAAVVFDFDGTIVDTESMSDTVLADVLAELGHEVGTDDLVATRGRVFSWLQDWLWDRWGVSAQTYQALAEPAWERLLEEGVPTFDDAMALLDELGRLDVPLAVCTSGSRDHLDRIVDMLGFDGRFVASVTSNDVAHHKPHPLPYRRAVELLDAPVARTVAIEDTVVGATSAVDAGLRVIGRPHPDMADLADIVHLQVDRLDLAAVRAVLVDT